MKINSNKLNKRGVIIIRDLIIPEMAGGIEKQVIWYATKYIQKGWRPIFVVGNLASKNSPFKKMAESSGAIWISTKHKQKKNFKELYRIISQLCRIYPIKIIQTHTFYESVCMRLFRIFHPSIKHISKVHTHIDCSTIPSFKKKLYHLIDWLTSFGVDHIIAISELVKKEMVRSRIFPEKITVIPNGVVSFDIKKHRITETEKPLISKLAVIGTIDGRKGHEILLEAMKMLKNEIQIKALFFGSLISTYEKKIKDKIEELGLQNQVIFIGFCPNLSSAIKDIEVIVLPSFIEGEPLSLLEAMSVGKLIISTNVDAIPEIISDGINGYLIPPGRPEILAKKLRWIFTTPSKFHVRIRRQACRNFEEKFNVERMLKKSIRVIEKVISN